ncbi:MAG: xanthine dehydrogenase family protein molybdopterin-binding subunit [Spirochaetota bacterium]
MREWVGKSARRLDALGKVTGKVKFAADLNFGNQLYAKTVYSRYPHARILEIETEEAEKLPGVAAVVTARDIPGVNRIFGRFQVLAEKEVKYVGDGVAVVAAESVSIAEKAVRLIKVKYEQLPAVLTVEEALAEDAPRVHEDEEGNLIEHTHHLMRAGDVEKGFAEAEVIIERAYRTQFIDHGYIEPEAVIAQSDPYRKGVEIYGSIQNPYNIRQSATEVLNLKLSEVRVVPSTLGGSFGGKDESVTFMALRTALLALKCGRPVKMVLTREESFLESSKRHPYAARYKLGARKDGTITALKDTVYAQGGAYNNKARFANWRGSVHAAGPYAIPNVKTDLYGVYTHTICSGAMRGFSAPQLVFCHESLIDELAAELKLSPKELRLKNCLKPGDEMVTGQSLKPGAMPAPLKEMIEEVCRRTDFDRQWQQLPLENKNSEFMKRGIGLACTFRGAGLGGEGIDTASATVTIEKDGSVNIQSGLSEMGQGIRTSHAQIVAEVLGISLDRITFSPTDTSVTMDSGPTVASRGLLAGGNAMLMAGKDLLNRLHDQAAELLECDPAELVSKNDKIYHKSNQDLNVSFEKIIHRCLIEKGMSLSAQGWYNPGPEKLSPETGRGRAYPTYIYGCAVTELTADMATGKIDVQKITAAYEVGYAINPQIVRSQLYGGLIQGLGYCLMEKLEESMGYLNTHNFDEFLMPTAKDIPEIELILYESDENVGPFGAKGVGEIGVELAAPSIANALYHASGRRLRELPLSLERVLLGRALVKTEEKVKHEGF